MKSHVNGPRQMRHRSALAVAGAVVLGASACTDNRPPSPRRGRRPGRREAEAVAGHLSLKQAHLPDILGDLPRKARQR
ncbi:MULTISPECIES: hypothetical protein [unclassified Streptomyces]|uniref:hypothetical protein n=1 Tax=unclassified Streptomyces TaxID=2593676 RepID=UPI000A8B4A4C|nr:MULTISPECIES: hypothetical protein [unclassified Streptomyces]THC51779.1 hypothetical protein E7X58_12230 [Streptomyces sp. A1499]